jgi:hypothetical protein
MYFSQTSNFFLRHYMTHDDNLIHAYLIERRSLEPTAETLPKPSEIGLNPPSRLAVIRRALVPANGDLGVNLGVNLGQSGSGRARVERIGRAEGMPVRMMISA